MDEKLRTNVKHIIMLTFLQSEGSQVQLYCRVLFNSKGHTGIPVYRRYWAKDQLFSLDKWRTTQRRAFQCTNKWASAKAHGFEGHPKLEPCPRWSKLAIFSLGLSSSVACPQISIQLGKIGFFGLIHMRIGHFLRPIIIKEHIFVCWVRNQPFPIWGTQFCSIPHILQGGSAHSCVFVYQPHQP